MRDFEWRSEKPLQSELVGRGAAVGFFFIAVCVWSFVLEHVLVGFVIAILGALLTALVVLRAEPTVVSVKGFALSYGRTMKMDLNGLREIRPVRQFGLQDMYLIKTARGQNVIPLDGMPQPIRADLRAVLEERISAT